MTTPTDETDQTDVETTAEQADTIDRAPAVRLSRPLSESYREVKNETPLWADLKNVVGAFDISDIDEDDVTSLGYFTPSYLRQWAEVLEFVYGDVGNTSNGWVELRTEERHGAKLLYGVHPEDDSAEPWVGLAPRVFPEDFPNDIEGAEGDR